MSLFPATPAPTFTAPSPANPEFISASLGGRYVLFAFLPEPGPARDAALALVQARKSAFADSSRIFFGVLPDEESFRKARTAPPFNWFGDWTGALRRLFRAVDDEGRLKPLWVAIDPAMRIIGSASLEHGAQVLDTFIGLGAPDDYAGVPLHAPVLISPRIFEPELCRRLIDLYQAQGGQPSGVMREINGRTVGVLDDFKKRSDASIEDEGLRSAIRARLAHRLIPEIERAFCFKPTRIERYIVACYDAASGGYFRPHKDNTTAGTAHRRLAVSINLNSEEFEGGDLRFPEFGSRTYRPPTGGAVVFSCSLLHEATAVTRGARYACLPFLFDEASETLRQKNLHLLQA